MRWCMPYSGLPRKLRRRHQVRTSKRVRFTRPSRAVGGREDNAMYQSEIIQGESVNQGISLRSINKQLRRIGLILVISYQFSADNPSPRDVRFQLKRHERDNEN